MRKYGVTFGWIGALIAAAILIIWSYGLKLGIDLSGGTILVYQVKEGTQTNSEMMDALIGALKRRINPEGLVDLPIRKVGNNRVEIILAEATPEEVDLLKRKITDVGSLEFRILANYKHDQAAVSRIDRAATPDQIFKQPPPGYRWIRLGETITGGKDDAGKDIPGTQAPVSVNSTEIRLPGRDLTRDRYKASQIVLTGRTATDTADTTRAFEIAGNAGDVVNLTQPHPFKTVSSYAIVYNPSEIVATGQQGPDPIVRAWDRGNGVTETYVLVVQDRENVTGEYLSRVYPTQDERVQPAVGFVFGPRGASKFGRLTGSHLPEEGGQFKYRLAVVLDEMVRSAPSINSEIRDSGIIEGVQADEVTYLIEILQSGSLPASIDPVPLLEEKVGPTLGRDTIDKGVRAIIISLCIVPLFMIFVYRFAGVVAVFALLLNMVLLVASMALTGSSFTLPGLAGLALTIGMAVDANVLIFERMREEKERGATLAQQIRNGYDRAWSTIFDSNVTTVLSGLVLWAVGTEEVKGFALTLIIGLLWNLFTAVYVTRLIFDFAYSKGWIKELHFHRLLGKTSIDFISRRRAFMAASAVLIAMGLFLFWNRGSSMYNIDFTGGTLVSVRLAPKAEVDGKSLEAMTPGQRSAYVRSKANDVLPDVTVETLTLVNDDNSYRFNIRTTAEDVKQVQDAVKQAFEGTLDEIATTVQGPTPIAGGTVPPAAGDEAKDATKATPTVGTIGPRFGGGSRFELTFNRPIEVSTVREGMLDLLRASELANPAARFEVVAADGSAEAVDGMTLSTDLPADQVKGYLTSLSNQLSSDPSLLFDRLENFGGAVAGETRSLAIIAIVASWLIIIAYLWFRFKSVSYGLAAVIALVHDVLITLGAVALTHYLGFFPTPYKIDLPTIAAFLTLIGFSVNDTIVIFDRIREIKGRTPQLTSNMINQAINQTLGRTFLTSLTAWLVVLIFYIFGGEGLRGFSFCLVVGFLSGIYSTIYIAAPVLIEWAGKHERTRKLPEKPVSTSV